jgi:hypothetical protein
LTAAAEPRLADRSQPTPARMSQPLDTAVRVQSRSLDRREKPLLASA